MLIISGVNDESVVNVPVQRQQHKSPAVLDLNDLNHFGC